jgi:methionyl-tRNA formyltransferase
MSARPWRVVIVSQLAQVARGYADLIRSLGHEPVAHVGVRRRKLGEDPPPAVVEFLTKLLVEGPEELPLLFPATKQQLAPLLRPFEPDLVLCTAFPWRIPGEALAVPRLGWLNGHPSSLPEYRGPTPIAWAVRNGETEIGLTYHLMDAQFDTGAILAQGSVPFDDGDTMTSLNEKFGPLSQTLLATAFERLASGDPGDEQVGGSYQSLFSDDYVPVDVTARAAEVHRQVQAWQFAPFALGERGPILERNGTRLRLVRTSLVEAEGAERLECADAPLWILETEPA